MGAMLAQYLVSKPGSHRWKLFAWFALVGVLLLIYVVLASS
jgi:hypothetical protein